MKIHILRGPAGVALEFSRVTASFYPFSWVWSTIKGGWCHYYERGPFGLSLKQARR